MYFSYRGQLLYKSFFGNLTLFLYHLVTFWAFSNSTRQIPPLSFSLCHYCFLPRCRCNPLLPIFHQDCCSSSRLNLWCITTPPLLSYLEWNHYHLGDFTQTLLHPPNLALLLSFFFTRLTESPGGVQSFNSPIKKKPNFCAICYYILQYTHTWTLWLYWPFVLALLDPGHDGFVACSDGLS